MSSEPRMSEEEVSIEERRAEDSPSVDGQETLEDAPSKREAGIECPSRDDDSEGQAPSSTSRELGWADKWWLWALAGLAFALFIGALHILT